MNQTIGQYLKFIPEEFPLVLEFDNFYYYETTNHNNTLLYRPTLKKIDDFTVTNNLLGEINEMFGLDISSLYIYDYHGTKVYWGAKGSYSGSEFIRGQR